MRYVKVTNNVRERGVKLITDYAKILTNNNAKRMMLLQGVEMVRKLQPDFKKKTMNNNSRWYPGKMNCGCTKNCLLHSDLLYQTTNII